MDIESWIFRYAVLIVGIVCAMVGFLLGYAEGLRHRPKQRICTDCGDKMDTLCHDCRWKLNGEMAS